MRTKMPDFTEVHPLQKFEIFVDGLGSHHHKVLQMQTGALAPVAVQE
jgi:hypothetical protein